MKGAPLQAGFGSGVKQFKKAVDRNRIKRLSKEVYRLQKPQLHDKLKNADRSMAVFFIYTAKQLPDYGLLYEKMGLILQRLINLTDENPAAHT